METSFTFFVSFICSLIDKLIKKITTMLKNVSLRVFQFNLFWLTF